MVGNSSAPNCLNCRRGRNEFKEHFYCWRNKISQVGECLAVVPIRENSKEEEERMGSMLKREKERGERNERVCPFVRSFVQSRRSTDNEARGRGEGGRDRGRDGQITLPPLFLSLSLLFPHGNSRYYLYREGIGGREVAGSATGRRRRRRRRRCHCGQPVSHSAFFGDGFLRFFH